MYKVFAVGLCLVLACSDVLGVYSSKGIWDSTLHRFRRQTTQHGVGDWCVIPPPLENGRLRPSFNRCKPDNVSPACRMTPGAYVFPQWVLYLDYCDTGYVMSSTHDIAVCVNGNWLPRLPSCAPSSTTTTTTTEITIIDDEEPNFPDKKNDTDYQENSDESKLNTPLITNGKSAEMCRKYGEFVKNKVVNNPDYCLLDDSLTSNATYAKPRQFPHMALIGFPRNSTKYANRKNWLCGGSLISERFVLSAAHCNNFYNNKPKWVRLGEYNVKSTLDEDENNTSPIDSEIIQTFQHPEYDSQRYPNDIVLFKLDRTVVFNEFIRPICLHTDHDLPTRSFSITGWGHIDKGVPSEGPMKKASVSYVPGRECGEMLKPALRNRQIELKVNTSMFCAADFVNGKANCQGDSGGPMQYQMTEPYCMFSQVGITSFGVKCGWKPGEPRFPEVFTRVSYFVPWIESIVWQ